MNDDDVKGRDVQIVMSAMRARTLTYEGVIMKMSVSNKGACERRGDKW